MAAHKKMVPGAGKTEMTNENLVIHSEMTDEDSESAPYLMGASIEEGCSGHRPIDTMYENFAQDYVDNPREGSTESPVCQTGSMYPHRRA